MHTKHFTVYFTNSYTLLFLQIFSTLIIFASNLDRSSNSYISKAFNAQAMKKNTKKLYNIYSKEDLQAKLAAEAGDRIVLSFYKYALLTDPEQFRNKLYSDFDNLGVLGRIYVSGEGVNAQISVPNQRFQDFEQFIHDHEVLSGIRLNIAIENENESFLKLKIKTRKKIVADGLDDASFDVTNRGIHLDAKSFNEITDREDTVIIDMRNHYESEVGHFEGAITPDVETFKESLPIIDEMLQEHKDKNIVMYCTGGIRCEKASAYYKHRGYEKVYQLDGGIIEYARQAEAQGLANKFKGKNFVFDERMGERISEDIISKCHQCETPNDNHTNCANEACHILFIQCSDCGDKYEGCCSEKCRDFNRLPQEEQGNLKPRMRFNGTLAGKGRYKAKRKDEELTE